MCIRDSLLGLFLEHADKLFADDLALLLGVGDALQLGKVAVLGVDAAEIHVHIAEDLLDLVAFFIAHETVIDEDAVELPAHGFRQQRRAHRGVHPARQGQQYLFVADLLPQLLDGYLAVVLHAPVAHAATHLIEEVFEHVVAVLGVVDLQVKLHRVEFAALILHSGHGAIIGVGGDSEALGHL